MKFEIELDHDVLLEAVQSAARAAFSSGYRYGDAPGFGYKAVQEQTKQHILALDFSDIIATEAKRQIADVVSEVVKTQLREAVKAQAMKMWQNGELLEDNHEC